MVTVTDDLIWAEPPEHRTLLWENEEPQPIDENDPSAQRLLTSGVMPVEVDLRRGSKGTDCKRRGDTAPREL